MIVFIDYWEMPDAFLVDEVSGLKKGCLRTDGDRISLYLFPHETLILNFHNLSSFQSLNLYSIFRKGSSKVSSRIPQPAFCIQQ
jgi:hypothetical protein